MDSATVDDLENQARAAAITKRLTGELGLEHGALNYYELAPGDSFSENLHTHMDQEETFYVIEGTATFETESDQITVGPHEAVRFAPGEYQQGRNEGDERVIALALGTPQGMGETRTRLPCSQCGEADYHEVIIEESGFTLSCPNCPSEFAV